MSLSKVGIGLAALALSASGAFVYEGVAQADGVVIHVPSPFFFPTPQFEYGDGYYYRHADRRYYHYDRDRDGWHYGRNHRDGMRFEARHRR
jgi:hypothetical protein